LCLNGIGYEVGVEFKIDYGKKRKENSKPIYAPLHSKEIKIDVYSNGRYVGL
jgi:hypothetical protein